MNHKLKFISLSNILLLIFILLLSGVIVLGMMSRIIDDIKIENKSEEYSVKFNGSYGFDQLSKKIKGWEVFREEGVYLNILGDDEKYERKPTHSLVVRFTDNLLPGGLTAVSGGDEVAASYAFYSSGDVGILEIGLDMSQINEISDDEKLRILNREVLLALFERSQVGYLEDDSFIEKRSELLKFLATEPIEKISFLVFN